MDRKLVSKLLSYNYPKIMALTFIIQVVSSFATAILAIKTAPETVPYQSLTETTPPLIPLTQMPF